MKRLSETTVELTEDELIVRDAFYLLLGNGYNAGLAVIRLRQCFGTAVSDDLYRYLETG